MPEAQDKRKERQDPRSSETSLPDFYACFSPCSFPSPSPASTGPAAVGNEPTRETGIWRWGLWSSHDDRWMRLVRDNYDRHHRVPRLSDLEGSRSRPPLIPLTIHHIWLGSPLPDSFARLRESWLSRHAGGGRRHDSLDGRSGEDDVHEEGGEGRNEEGAWELRLWTDEDVDAFGLENREAYEAAGNFGQKSDIFRYEILLRHGGLYVDVDFLCLGSFRDLHRRYQFYTGLSNSGTFELNNGLIGCCPGHPIMRDIVNKIRETCGPRSPTPPPALHTSSSPGIAPLPGGVPAGWEACCGGKSEAGSGGTRIEGGGSAVGGGSLSALLGALGGGGATPGQESTGRGGGLLAGFLSGEDNSRFEKAVKVEPGSATETIVKTGPGVFTRAVMTWMVAEATTSDDDDAGGGRSKSTSSDGGIRNGCVEEKIANGARTNGTACGVAPAAAEYRNSGSGCKRTDSATGTGAEDSVAKNPSPEFHRYNEKDAGALPVVMILPPSYLYPIPNNATVAKDGELVGDGTEWGIRERAGDFFSPESLAAHLWGKSWQGVGDVKR